MIPQSIIKAVQICALRGVRQVVLSPGSRCAPLTLAFVRHPNLVTHTFSDERSAAFIAIGMAQQLRHPVVLVCTSGSAAYNYAPAIAEAYFQHIPLLVFTADRPPEWIDQLDGQTIRQKNIYGSHVKASYELPLDQPHPDVQWHATRIISEAINISRTFPCGPVHINVPVREPFYPESNEIINFNVPVKVIENEQGELTLTNPQTEKLKKEWERFDKKLIICGQQPYHPKLTHIISSLSESQSIPVIADVISNQHSVGQAIQHSDILLAHKNEETLKGLQPDLLITFGLSVISKNLKLFLRKYQPKAHWHIQPAGYVADSFQSLTRIVRASPELVLKTFYGFSKENEKTYYNQWQREERKAKELIRNLFSRTLKISNEDLNNSGEFEAVKLVMECLPNQVNLHLANSMPVRYANLVGIQQKSEDLEIFANRGTSGIDGSTSTSVGASLISDKLTVLITGDMAFFYDRNAFWHNYKLPNLRVVLLNNHGGGIFRMINGPSQQPELEEYFETVQQLHAENTARDFQVSYTACDLRKAGELEKLKLLLPVFLERKENDTHGKILEIISDGKLNQQIFNQYKTLIKESYGA